MIEPMTRTEEMRMVLDRWRASGQSLMAFGRQEDLPYSQLVYWKRKFEGDAPTESVELVPIQVAPDGADVSTRPSARKIEVWLANGICLDVASGFDAEELRRLVGVLQSC